MNLIAVVVLSGLMGVLFYELFTRLKLIGDIQQLFKVAPAAINIIGSTTLSDEEKEKAVRRMSLTVLKDTFTFTAKLACILLSCVALAASAQFLFKISPDGLGALLASWQGLIAAIVAVALYTRFKPAAKSIRESDAVSAGEHADSFASSAQYSALDRILHRVAFMHPGLQKVLGDVENDVFKKQLARVELSRPVFVTGLPRAGTTLLLELLYDTGQFASFTYRQMPFVLNPLLWDRLSSGSRKQAEATERAHGDGMLVSYDSPEAFEEVLWVSYMGKSLFDKAGMRPLKPTDIDERFSDAFVNLVRKIVCLDTMNTQRKKLTPSSPRYLSKNNANLSRLDTICSVFNDADLLLCYRHPSTHVTSLHTQHLRFLEMHKDDPFARNYMRWIGHHDFGDNFRPIHFDGDIIHDPKQPLFWLQYWIDAYRFVLANAPEHTQFIGYESLLSNGASDLGNLATRLGLNDTATTTLTAAAKRLRAPGSGAANLSLLSADLSVEAESIYHQLIARSVSQGYSGSVRSLNEDMAEPC